jgi:hypothetical protein
VAPYQSSLEGGLPAISVPYRIARPGTIPEKSNAHDSYLFSPPSPEGWLLVVLDVPPALVSG